MFEEVYLGYSFIDYFIHHYNIDNPVTPILTTEIMSISSTLYKVRTYFRNFVSYVSDNGLVISEKKQLNILNKILFSHLILT